MSGGAGNDTLTGGKGNDLFIYSGGKDVITDYEAGDKISVGAPITKSSVKGSNVILKTGVGTLTVKNAKDKELALKVTGSAGNNSLIGGDGSDTLSGGEGNDTLTGGKGNDLFIYSGGKDVITDYEAGDKISVGAPITKSSVKGSNVILKTGVGTLTVKNAKDKELALKVTGSAGNNSLIGGDGSDTLSGGEGNDTLTGGKGNDLFIYSAGNDVITDYEAGDKISVGAPITKSSVKGSDVILKTDVGTLTVKNAKNKELALKITGSAGNDSLIGGDGSDTLFGGEGNDTLTGGKGNDLFIYSGGKDVITDYEAGDKISVGAPITKSSVKGSNVILKTDVGTLTVKNAKNKELALKVTGSAGNDLLTGGEGNSTLVGGEGNDTLTGKTGNDKLYGQNGNDSLIGGDGKDTLSGGEGNDTLTGGKGKDLFIYSGGKDVITDYAAGDRISIGAAISKSSVKGSDATFTINSDTLTVKNGKGKELSFIEADGTARTIIGGAQLFTNSSSAKVTLSSGIEVGDASERTKVIKLTGNAKANTILGGSGNDSLYGKNGDDYLVGGAGKDIIYGNKGNDTLWGGAGNDTLYGGDGKDTFIYKPGEGTDTIFDYQSGDMLQILKSDGTASGSFTKSAFGDGNLTLTISGGGKIVFEGVSSGESFNINGKNYTLSGKKLK